MNLYAYQLRVSRLTSHSTFGSCPHRCCQDGSALVLLQGLYSPSCSSIGLDRLCFLIIVGLAVSNVDGNDFSRIGEFIQASLIHHVTGSTPQSILAVVRSEHSWMALIAA